MGQAAAGRHPLGIAGVEHPATPLVVGVVQLAGQHIRDRLQAAVRVVVEGFALKLVFHHYQEGVKQLRLAGRQHEAG